MSYAQIEVSAPRHQKLSTLSDVAFRLWISGLCYCQEHLSDGVLTSRALLTLTPTRITKRAVIDELVASGLWDASGDGEWRVHDYLAWNESRAHVEARRARWRRRRQPKVAPDPPPRDGTPERTPGTPTGTPHERTRYAPLRSATQRTNQDQKHPADAGTPRPRLVATDPTADPNPKTLAAIAIDLLERNSQLDGADLKEELKRRAGQLHVPYDSRAINKALDGVQAYRAKQEAS